MSSAPWQKIYYQKVTSSYNIGCRPSKLSMNCICTRQNIFYEGRSITASETNCETGESRATGSRDILLVRVEILTTCSTEIYHREIFHAKLTQTEMEDQRTSKMIFLRSGSSGFFFRSVALSERSFERRAIKITLSLPPLPLQAGFIEIPEELSGRYLSAPSSAADRFNRYFFPRVEDNRSARIIRDKRGPLSAYKRDSYEIAE